MHRILALEDQPIKESDMTNLENNPINESQQTITYGTVLLRWPDVERRVGISRSQAHKLIAKGRFPAAVKLGLRASAWVETEIEDWLQSRIADSRPRVKEESANVEPV